MRSIWIVVVARYTGGARYVVTTENNAETRKMIRIVHLRLRKMRTRSRRCSVCSSRSGPPNSGPISWASAPPRNASAVRRPGREGMFESGRWFMRGLPVERVEEVEHVLQRRILQHHARRRAIDHDEVVVHDRGILDLAVADTLDVVRGDDALAARVAAEEQHLRHVAQ